MFAHFLFSVNTVLPIFAVIAVGFALKRLEFLPENFFAAGNKFVFYILLPCAIFISAYASDLREIVSVGFAAFAVGASVASWAVTWAAARFFIRDRAVLGSFVQGAFRSNMVFVGIPVMRNLAGEAGVARFALIVALIMPVYNICSILVLSACSQRDERLKAKTVALTIVKNPLIIAIALGSAFSLSGFNLPSAAYRTMSELSAMAGPMSLLCLGGGMAFVGFDKKFKYALVAAVVKVAVLPVAFGLAAFALGFSGVDLAAFVVLGGIPTAFASYIMAVQIGCDEYTSGTIIVISTMLSAVTLTLCVYVLLLLPQLNLANYLPLF